MEYKLRFHSVDEGFCRVMYYHQRETTGRAWYCLQDEGKYSGVKLYRCSGDAEYMEPDHETRFKVYVEIDRPVAYIDTELINRVNEWIDNYNKQWEK